MLYTSYMVKQTQETKEIEMTKQVSIEQHIEMLQSLANDLTLTPTWEHLDAIIITAKRISDMQSELDMIDDQPLASGGGWVVANV